MCVQMIVSADKTWFGILASLKIIAQIHDRFITLVTFCYILITFLLHLLHRITKRTFIFVTFLLHLAR